MRLPSCLFAAALALLLAACNTKNPNGMPGETAAPASVQALPATAPKPDSAAARTENAVMPTDTSVAGAWLLLEGALRGHDAQVLNQLIDPEFGLWILEQPGALPLVTRVVEAGAFRRADQNRLLFSLDKQLMTCPQLQVLKQLPAADCALQTKQNAGFAQQGCFSGPATAFRALDFWPSATVKGATAAQGKAAQGRTVRSVLQTRTGFRFHFAKSAGAGGRWRLIFMDLRQPCSA
ncbi:hypothetical protein [Hymenobacter arizonensis]|uniref:Uncharacterized protein n=1 Tax=Hymenobacter arizonensis TaxID=1227077 RepID=A0A1I5U186_HYMAR|nr:hypothetical protein [Hymenobacter arizonensis]SFP89053.1 hypothetical protein SAMN04515668_0715 [Hymenobacter arizonensis]